MNRMFPPALRVAMVGLGLLAAREAAAQEPSSGQMTWPGEPSGQLPPGIAPPPRMGAPAPGVAPEAMPGAPAPMPGAPEAMPGAPEAAPPAEMAPPTQPFAPTPTPTAPSALDAASTGAAPFSGLGGGLSGSGAGLLTMLGDGPEPARVRVLQRQPPTPPVVPPPGRPPVPGTPPEGILSGAAIVPSIRSPKVSENQSPQPQDRIYFAFNAYDEVNRTLNARQGSVLYNLRAYRELLGFEKTFFDGNGSIGLRLPINQLNADSFTGVGGGSSSAVGNLAVILKYAFLWNRDTGSLLSGGLMIDTPTGPSTFAGFPNLQGINSTTLVPYIGYIYNLSENAYFHGFSSIAVPTTGRDVTVLYNDLGLGYFLYRAEDPDRWLTAIVPTFEGHINVPLNHTDYLNFNDPAGTPNVINLTFGCNFGIGRHGLLSVGYACPVTGPRPFDNEWLAMFNYRF